MKDLQEAIAKTVAEMVASGAIAKRIEENTVKMVNSAIDGVFDYEMKKKLTEGLSEGLQFNPSQLGLQEYHDLLQKVIRQRVQAVLTAEKFAKLDEFIAEILKEAPQEIKLSELIEEFKEQYSDEIEGEFTLHIDRDTSFTHIYMSPEAPKKSMSKYNCKIQISVHGDRVFTAEVNGRKCEEKIFIQPLYGFDLLVYQLYLNKSRLIIDNTSFDTYVNDEMED